MRNPLLISLLILAACAPSSMDEQISEYTLQPYHTLTPVDTDTPDIAFAETPLPTPTPFTYVIQPGDTFSELADTFNISQDDLRAANPGLDPNSLTIGITILVPSISSAAAGAATPTPMPVPITQTVCHPTADNGLWCFALVHNNTSEALENISAQITLMDQSSAVIASQTAWTLLDILPPNSSLPVYAFFANTPPDANPRVQLLSAFQLSNTNSRYLPAILDNTLAQIDWEGRTAQLSGYVYLPPESKAAAQVWVAAVAYDKSGYVIGLKRWEGGAIQPGTYIPFNFVVASTASTIDSVDFVVQATP